MKTKRTLYYASIEPYCVSNHDTFTRLTNAFALGGFRARPIEGLRGRAGPDDCFLVVSCVVTQAHQEKVKRAVECWERAGGGGDAWVAGCQVKELGLVGRPGVRLVPPGKEESVAEELGLPAACVRSYLPPRVLQPREAPHTKRLGYLRCSTGCLGRCSFCVIRKAKGRLRSRLPAEIARELLKGLRMGCFDDFMLMGDDLAAYGKDIGADLPRLLKILLAGKAAFGLWLEYLEPFGLIELWPDLRPAFRTGRIRGLSTGLQSASPRILRKMGRSYDVEAALRTLGEVKRLSPGTRLSTDILVGFPTETREEFEASIEAVRDVFDFVNFIRFSPDPNTPAGRMEGRLSDGEMAWRTDRIRRLVAEQPGRCFLDR